MKRETTLLVTVAIAGPLVVGSAAPAAATTEPSITVALSDDGAADITVTSTFDLDDDAEAAAFGELRDDETIRETYTDRFRDRWESLANATAESTGREMTVEDVSLKLTRDGSTGIATVTATWSGLAAIDDDRLTLTEPFASGYVADRPVTIVLPDGYEPANAQPEPSGDGAAALTYDAGAEFDGFELVAERSAGDGTDTGTGVDRTETGTTGGNAPGFDVIAALAGLAVAGLLARAGNRMN